jgi:pimeloyl-ACP methyl ester carboxylesterase
VTKFVLIHGAYQGGWIWNSITTRLRAAGHLAYSPSLDGCGERAMHLRPGITTESQAEEIAQFLYYEDLSEVVLVGTSSGGMVVAKAAELARERVEHLVFVDALVLMHGERIRHIVGGPRPSQINTKVATGRSREDTLENLRRDLEPETAVWAADRFGLHPIAAFTQPILLQSFWDQRWNVSVIWCRQAANPGETHQRRCADALGARWEELDTGHYPMLSAPDELTRLIVQR